jgi:Ca2+-transporting ATPase
MDLASSTIFVTEVAEPDVLKRQPLKIDEYLRRSILLSIFKNGVGLAVGILVIYLLLFYQTGDIVLAQTAAFVTWLLGHILLALNLKQEKVPLLKQGVLSNRFGSFWLVSMAGLTILITNVAAVFPHIKTTSLSPLLWSEILFTVFAATFWIEVKKLMVGIDEEKKTRKVFGHK